MFAIVLVPAAACELEPPVAERDAAVVLDLIAAWDLSAVDLRDDAALVLDLASDGTAAKPARGARCADTQCFPEGNQYCHTTDWGETGICVVRPSPGAGYYGCDGPEDCASGACCFLASSSVCSSFPFCVSGTTVGEFMCHEDVQCGVMSRCCPKGATGSYRRCIDGLSPADPCPNPP